jgi:UDPglucose 6-dehydrogenase
MKITMVGSGYVGLCTGAMFSEIGNYVTCADIDADKIQKLQAGIMPIYEPGLEHMIQSNSKHNRLVFTTDVGSAIKSADAVFIAVGTPQASDGSADLSYVYAAARMIGEIIRDTKHYTKVVVVKSTVPVGTTKNVERIISSFVPEQSICVANNPEFLREGTAIEDAMRPDRIVIGTSSEYAKKTLLRMYKPLTSVTSLLTMDSTSSELVKYAANSLLATRITFMNELANLVAAVGADINHVREGLGSDHRIGHKYLYPGPGYGGSCFPKDVSAMLNIAKNFGVNLKIVDATQQANELQRHVLGDMVINYFKTMKSKVVAVLGTAFKAETDDVRESPAFAFIDDMLDHGALVVVHDPQALETTRKVYGSRIRYADDMYDVIEDADVIGICTEWREYRNPDFLLIKAKAPNAVVFDGRNIWVQEELERQGIKYFAIGRPMKLR